MQKKEFSFEIGGKIVRAIFSDLAEQANGSVMLECEGTVILATACISSSSKNNPGFFNLTVEYLEKFYAAGKILGSQFSRREGRPSDAAILAARVTDRTLRPLFEHHIKNALQVIITVIACGKADPKTLGINAASLALAVSDIPWAGPIGCVHISTTKENKEPQINNYIPSSDESVYELDLLICGKDKTINMIEAMAYESKNEDMSRYFDMALTEIEKWEEFQKNIVSQIGKEKMSFPKIEIPNEVKELFKEKIQDSLDEHLFTKDGKKVTEQLEQTWKELLKEKYKEDEEILNVGFDHMHHVLDNMFHEYALEKNMRADGRSFDQVRGLYAQPGNISPMLHGSGIFYRGETHVLSVLTLAGPDAMHTIDGIESSYKKRFMHHYNFPPYSSGETGRVGGLNRREMGHGFLVEKALTAVMPDKINFPYTIRVVSESVASNGSTSQASICATTIALLDGGVPIKNPVAGISIGLMLDVKNKNKYVLLTDIQGPEDHYGDMDFKIGGTINGITAIQLDVKVDGIPVNILKDALDKALSARLQIIETIKTAIPEARKEISIHAPKIVVTKINKDQIGLLIGPGGKTINAIREKTNTEITIEEDGTVYITGRGTGAEEAKAIVEEMTHEYKIGDESSGQVVKIMEFGVFVKIGNNTEGLVHVSEMAPFRIEKISDYIKEGDMVKVKIIKVDEKGRLNFSIKAVDEKFFIKK